MKTIKEILTLSTEYLAKTGIDSPRVDAEWLIGHALGLSRVQLYMQYERPIVENELEKIRPLIARRAKKEPVQYICGSTEFYGYEFLVGPGVLIPRPETELLVGEILKKFNSEISILDLCCGSGVIGITLKKRNPKFQITSVDISEEALEYTKKNTHLHKVELEIIQGDLFNPLEGRLFDVIAVNPPYVKTTEKSLMGTDVLLHEPSLALFSGEDGLDILRNLAKNSPRYLKSGGYFISEIGYSQGETCLTLFGETNMWEKIKILKDLTGRDRFIECYKI